MQPTIPDNESGENMIKKKDFFLSCCFILSVCLLVFMLTPYVSPQLNIHGGRSLQNRSKRFQEVASKVPGPGAYNVLPASGNTLRAATADPGQAERPGRKTVGIWMKL